MRQLYLQLIMIFSFLNFGVAQVEEATPITFPEFQFLRSDENYSFLKNNRVSNVWWRQLKYIPIGVNSFVSIGGDIRSQFQVLRNEEWKDDSNDAALFQRFMVHSDWDFGNHIRVFSQLKNGFTVGRNGPKFPLDDEILAFHQLFLGVNWGNSTIEIGRREIRYGARRLISVREGTNIRQSFDGARWIWKKMNHQFDILFYAYHPQRVAFFDNKINTDQLLWGGYWVWNRPNTTDLNLDIYYLGVRNNQTSFEEGTDKEVRHSFGIRHWGDTEKWDYNSEAILQTGSFGSSTISAWTVSMDVNYQLSGKNNPKIGLKAEIISGDKNPLDGDLQTFNPLYPRGGYFGLLALIGPTNIFDIHPSCGVSIGEKWRLNLDWDFFWRHRLSDGIYFPSGRLNVSGQNTSERFIGHQPGIQLSRPINRFVEFEMSYFLFVAGNFIKDVSDGENFSQLGTSINIKF